MQLRAYACDDTMKGSFAGTTCPAGGTTTLIEDNVYDHKSRLIEYRYYDGAPMAPRVERRKAAPCLLLVPGSVELRHAERRAVSLLETATAGGGDAPLCR